MVQQAIGMIECKGLCALLEACDAALKAANITLVGWEKIGSGYVTGFFRGDVAAVKKGAHAGAAAAAPVGQGVSGQGIPRPHHGPALPREWVQIVRYKNTLVHGFIRSSAAPPNPLP